jgi:hypothetical protein
VHRTAQKWGVCTTIFTPSDAIRKVVALEGWRVVVVGDRGAAAFNATAPNLVYLSAADQEQLAGANAPLLKLLPWKHFGLKTAFESLI